MRGVSFDKHINVVIIIIIIRNEIIDKQLCWNDCKRKMASDNGRNGMKKKMPQVIGGRCRFQQSSTASKHTCRFCSRMASLLC
jgi:hypothetical protein